MEASTGGRRIAAMALAATLAAAGACGSATGRLPTATGTIALSPAAAREVGAPRVNVETEVEQFGVRQVRTKLRLEDDAYVLVVNVAPDGTAHIIFPETPADTAILRARRSYVLASFFSGYPSVALTTQPTTTRYVTISRSGLAGSTIRGPGYVFALASRTPFDLQRLEDDGLFDWISVGSHLQALDPERVIPRVADVAFWNRPDFVASTDYARYAGYDPVAGERMTLRYAGTGAFGCYGYDPLLLGAFEGFRSQRSPCSAWGDDAVRRRLIGFPVQPRPDSSAADSTSADTLARRPSIWRRYALTGGDPVGAPVTGASKSVGGVAGTEEVELTREAREQMLQRERMAGRRGGSSGDGTPERRPRALGGDARSTYEPGRLGDRRAPASRSPRGGAVRSGDAGRMADVVPRDRGSGASGSTFGPGTGASPGSVPARDADRTSRREDGGASGRGSQSAQPN